MLAAHGPYRGVGVRAGGRGVLVGRTPGVTRPSTRWAIVATGRSVIVGGAPRVDPLAGAAVGVDPARAGGARGSGVGVRTDPLAGAAPAGGVTSSRRNRSPPAVGVVTTDAAVAGRVVTAAVGEVARETTTTVPFARGVAASWSNGRHPVASSAAAADSATPKQWRLVGVLARVQMLIAGSRWG